jgi:aldehyde dehydrogenase (NAD+)
MTNPTLPATRKLQLFIDGDWHDALSGRTFESINPATRAVNATVAEADTADVARAVEAARRAQPQWAALPAAERGRFLWKMAAALRERREDLARLESLDVGKPLRDARGDVDVAAEILEYWAGAPTKITGEVMPVTAPMFNYVVREPIGVIGAIVPWNFPLQIACIKVGPALACGNTVLLKPAEDTPLTALELARIAADIGLPRGVLNVLPGFGATAGEAIVRHPGVGKITFTGSLAVGQRIMHACADQMKRVSLELGGKSPLVVLADADVAAAARAAVMGICMNTGQICCATTRLYVDRRVREPLLAAMEDELRHVKVGDPLDPATRMGPLVSARQRERVENHIQAGRAEGATLLRGGDRPAGLEQGFFLNPTFFGNVRGNMRIAREEIFGPVLCIQDFADPAEALQAANDTDYALAAAVWTRDLARAHEFARRLRAGSVWVNTVLQSSVMSPWGGPRNSGQNRDNAMQAVEHFTEPKSVWIDTSAEAAPSAYR